MADLNPKSILDSIKKACGIHHEDDVFDTDIIMAINSEFSTLAQIGCGPEDGFEIEDNTTEWSEFLGANKLINNVKSFIFLRTQIMFDPPASSFALTAKQNMAQEYLWRINVAVDKYRWIEDGTSISGGEFMWELPAPNVWPDEAEEGDLGIYLETGQIWRKK